jgi:hypothetical protein
MPKMIFFAYPSRPPAIREAAARGADLIAATNLADTQTWESLRVGGRFVIGEITTAIEAADVTCLVVTSLNHNVLFEAGYAVGVGRAIWPLLDTTYADSMQNWDDFRLLTTVGYETYVSSEDIRTAFLHKSPLEGARPLLEGADLRPGAPPGLFYMEALYRTDDAIAITRAISAWEKSGHKVLAADPTEASVYPLPWYAQQVFGSKAVIVHFTPEDRSGALVHNARCALVAGMAHGMGRDLLMLADSDYYSPIDYRDLLHVFQSSKDASSHVSKWLDGRPESVAEAEYKKAERLRRLELATELSRLRLGEDVAEYESDDLEEYFVETQSFRQVLERSTTLFVGRKGTGKTASFLRAAAALSADPRNLVVVIKPPSYEIEAVLALMVHYRRPEARSHLVNALWQYLLYSELARQASEAIKRRPAGLFGASEQETRLVDYCEDPANLLDQDFAVRLERVANELSKRPVPDGVEATRDLISESLHAGRIGELRRMLGQSLQAWDRVAVLIDNLDKGWDRSADIDELSHLLWVCFQQSATLRESCSARVFRAEEPSKSRWPHFFAVTSSMP